jgi:hypothetical protein
MGTDYLPRGRDKAVGGPSAIATKINYSFKILVHRVTFCHKERKNEIKTEREKQKGRYVRLIALLTSLCAFFAQTNHVIGVRRTSISRHSYSY